MFTFGQKVYVVKISYSERGPYYDRGMRPSYADVAEATVLQADSETVAAVTEKGKVRFHKPEHVFATSSEAGAFIDANCDGNRSECYDLARVLGLSPY